MKTFTEELWYGNIFPSSGCRETNNDTKALMDYIARHHEKLLSLLSSERREVLESFTTCSSELMDINERNIFVYAFRLGARMAIEIMSEEI